MLSDNTSSNALDERSFTGGVASSLLLACIAIMGFLLLYVVVKHAFKGSVNSKNDHEPADLDEDSCDEACGPEWMQSKNYEIDQ